MNKFLVLCSIFSILIISFFAIELFSQKGDDKINGFNQSIKFESDKKYQKALEALTKIYDDNKSDYLINLRLGWLYYMTADYSKSKDFYQNALNLHPTGIEPMLGLTLPLAALNEWDNVKTIYLNILKLDPGNYTANLRLGQYYNYRKDYKTAQTYLEKMKNLYPGLYEVNLSLGWTYFYLGKTAAAKELFTNALMLSAGDTLALQGLKLIRN